MKTTGPEVQRYDLASSTVASIDEHFGLIEQRSYRVILRSKTVGVRPEISDSS